MDRFKITLYINTFKFLLKYLGKKHRPKTPLEVYQTIETFKFGFENYNYSRGIFKRKKGV